MTRRIGDVVNLVQSNAQHQAETALKEAARLGLGVQPTDNHSNYVVADQRRFQELMTYCTFDST